MTFLPIIARELRARARSRATYWTRFAVALAGMLICLPQLAMPGLNGTAASLGRNVFDGIVAASFALCCCACLLTADAVSSERREGTLGLLLLTRVNRFDVLLGKLGSVGLTALCALVVLLPMLMIPVLAGGVTAGEALCKGLGLVNALFFALAVGLFASTLRRERVKTAGWALGLVALGVVVPFVCGLSSSPPAFISLFSPLFGVIWEPHQPLSRWFASVIMVQGMTWLALVCAAAELHQSLREEGRADGPEPLFRAEDAVVRRRWQPLQGGTATVEWLVCRKHGISAAIWTAMSVGILHLFVSPWLYRAIGSRGVSWNVTMVLTGLAVSLFQGALLAWAASRFFIEARQTGELELLLTTPLGAEAIVSGQWNALKRLLRWPVAALLAATILRYFFNYNSWSRSPSGIWPNILVSMPLSVGHLLLWIGAVCWAGLWFGFKVRRQAGAIVWTVGLTGGVPLLANLLSVLGQIILFPFLVRSSRTWASSYVNFPWVLSQVAVLFFYLWLIRWAKRRLLERLTGAGPMSASLRPRIVAAIRNARRWTPAGGIQ
jgi:hypothetical protein